MGLYFVVVSAFCVCFVLLVFLPVCVVSAVDLIAAHEEAPRRAHGHEITILRGFDCTWSSPVTPERPFRHKPDKGVAATLDFLDRLGTSTEAAPSSKVLQNLVQNGKAMKMMETVIGIAGWRTVVEMARLAMATEAKRIVVLWISG